MPTIQVAGHEVLVDSCDEHILTGVAWLIRGRYGTSYVGRYVRDSVGRLKVVHLHRVITGCPDDKVVDHINGNRLDNRRDNLRICTQAENLRNRKIHRNNSCGYKGVYFDPDSRGRKPWRAQLRVSGKRINIGRYETPEQAYAAYCQTSTAKHGEFSRLA